LHKLIVFRDKRFYCIAACSVTRVAAEKYFSGKKSFDHPRRLVDRASNKLTPAKNYGFAVVAPLVDAILFSDHKQKPFKPRVFNFNLW